MRYLIDGYNLLHAVGWLNGKVGPRGLAKARLALLGHLCSHYGTEAATVTVVFDAANAPPGVGPREDYQGVQVLYAVRAQADDLIEELIDNDHAPQQLTVVSDDHRLQRAGRHRHCPVVGCLDYYEQLARPRPRPAAAGDQPLGKPDRISPEETRHWLKEFADLADDPRLREELNPGIHGTGED